MRASRVLHRFVGRAPLIRTENRNKAGARAVHEVIADERRHESAAFGAWVNAFGHA